MLCKNTMGLDKMKEAFEGLVPGYSHEHSVRILAPPSARTPRTRAVFHVSSSFLVRDVTTLLCALSPQAFNYEHPEVV